MIFDTNLKNLSKICSKKELYKERIEELEGFIFNQYPVVDMLLEEKFENDKVTDLGLDENIRTALTAIFDTIIRQKDCSDFFATLDEKCEETVNQIIIILYNYVLNKIKFDEIKYSLYLMLYKINFLDYFDISMKAAVCVLELLNKGVDISLLAGCGNYYIEFVEEVANGKYPDLDYTKFRGNIVISIDDCMITNEDILITFEDGKELLFEKAESDIVLIFDSNDLKIPIAIVNNENDFLVGSFKTFDKYYNKKESNEKEYDGIDEIIEFYNNANNC